MDFDKYILVPYHYINDSKYIIYKRIYSDKYYKFKINNHKEYDLCEKYNNKNEIYNIINDNNDKEWLLPYFLRIKHNDYIYLFLLDEDHYFENNNNIYIIIIFIIFIILMF